MWKRDKMQLWNLELCYLTYFDVVSFDIWYVGQHVLGRSTAILEKMLEKSVLHFSSMNFKIAKFYYCSNNKKGNFCHYSAPLMISKKRSSHDWSKPIMPKFVVLLTHVDKDVFVTIIAWLGCMFWDTQSSWTIAPDPKF